MKAIKLHRDSTVSVWDVYTQQWVRMEPSDALRHQSWQGLSHHDRARIEAAAAGTTLTANRRLARQIAAAADDGGTIQAGYMVDYCANPRNHTCMSVSRAFRVCGCEYAAVLEFSWFGVEDFAN